jgi:predicted SAM-dependent methyltransferase
MSNILRSLAGGIRAPAGKLRAGKRVLNVGGNDRRTPIPAHYAGWDHVLLDIDAKVHPDIVCDARQLASLPAAQFDAVYCSHNLEHYYPHDGRKVLRGFLHVLRPEGFAEIRVPDLNSVMEKVIKSKLDIEQVLYVAPAGPITVRDVIFGYAREIEESGHDYFAHKTGFTPRSLYRLLMEAGFAEVFVSVASELFDMRAVAFKGAATPQQRTLLELPDEPS